MADFAGLCEALGPDARCNELMSEHTTLRIGGPADVYLVVYGATDLMGAVRVARTYHAPLFLLGDGANLLVSDAGIRGVVIENRAQSVTVRCLDDGIVIVAESGAALAEVSRYCTRRGIGGLEWAVDVTGSVGGATVGNAGAYGGRMSDLVRAAAVFTTENEIETLTAEQIGFGYRTSGLKQQGPNGGDRTVVLSVEMLLHWGVREELEQQASEYTQRRWERQPPEPSAGSIFKRTVTHPAGYLIEQAGLKGLRLGQAQISPKHANVIINLGGATANDVRMLIEIVQMMVRERFGQVLEPEIELAGEWPERLATLPPWQPGR